LLLEWELQCLTVALVMMMALVQMKLQGEEVQN